MHRDSQSQNGVQADCILKQDLEYFHTVTGFPPDALHNLFEGISKNADDSVIISLFAGS